MLLQFQLNPATGSMDAATGGEGESREKGPNCQVLSTYACWAVREEPKAFNPHALTLSVFFMRRLYLWSLDVVRKRYAFCCSCIFPKPITMKFLALRHRALPAMLPLLLWRLKQLRAPKACYGSLRLFESGMLFKKYAGSLGQVLMMLVLLLSWSSNVECFAQARYSFCHRQDII